MKTLPKVNVVSMANRLDPFTSDGTPKDPDHSPVFRAVLEFILSKPHDRRHAHIGESLTLAANDDLCLNGTYVGSGGELERLLREWWDDQGLFNEDAGAPRAFQVMLDDTIGYQAGAQRVCIKEFLR